MGDFGDPVEIGEVVEGRYKVLKLLGVGGMGSVFLAEHWLIKRRVAMKFLHRELIADANMIRRFMNEALAAGTLGHPNIVEATDMGFTKSDVPYIVFEYVDGTSLCEEVARLGALPVRRALKIAYQIASALEAAHNASIVHRDLKSENIFLIDKDDVIDHVKVLDFGISRFLAQTDRTALGSNTMGTPEFMAPEQIMTPDSVDKRADIYALGVVIYEMLSGSVPFPFIGIEGDLTDTHTLLHKIISDVPPRLQRRDAPPGLAQMIADNMLAKDPGSRYPSMAEVRSSLAGFSSALRRSGSTGSQPDPTEIGEFRAVDALSEQPLAAASLSEDELARQVKQLGKRWSIVGTDLRLEVYSGSMTKLSAVIAHAAKIADELENHPNVMIEPPRMTLTIRPDNSTALTAFDLAFAARIEQWLLANSW